jgi:hypothetical protein
MVKIRDVEHVFVYKDPELANHRTSIQYLMCTRFKL